MGSSVIVLATAARRSGNTPKTCLPATSSGVAWVITLTPAGMIPCPTRYSTSAAWRVTTTMSCAPCGAVAGDVSLMATTPVCRSPDRHTGVVDGTLSIHGALVAAHRFLSLAAAAAGIRTSTPSRRRRSTAHAMSRAPRLASGVEGGPSRLARPSRSKFRARPSRTRRPRTRTRSPARPTHQRRNTPGGRHTCRPRARA